jgi:hypothetical protein
MSSLPLAGQDGTLRRYASSTVAHLKTGSLRDVVGVALRRMEQELEGEEDKAEILKLIKDEMGRG